MKKTLKKLLIAYLCLCFIGTTCFFGVGGGIFCFSLVRRENTGYNSKNNSTWLSQNSTDTYITSDDGLKLHAHYKENPNADGKYAIVCHGYSGKAVYMTSHAKKLYDTGFSVLVPNARAHGKSEGSVRGMGYLERRDIILWINEILKDDPSAEILLFGISMGGATVLFTSGEKDLPENVKAVVSDCAFTSVYKEFDNVINSYVSFVSGFPVIDSVSVVCEIFGGYSFRDASCVKAVKRSTTPTLFIHGSADTYVPFSMLDTLYKNAACEKKKLVIEGAGHAASDTTDPELYWGTIESFIANYFSL